MTFDPETDLQIERLIKAAPETIWRCWEEPELFKQWFTPPAVETVECENDLRAGGRAYNVMKLPDGTLFENDGCFVLAERFKRLVYTDGMLPGFRPAPDCFMVADVRLIPQDHGTLYHAHVMHRTAENRQKHEEMGFSEGWGITLDQLSDLASRL